MNEYKKYWKVTIRNSEFDEVHNRVKDLNEFFKSAGVDEEEYGVDWVKIVKLTKWEFEDTEK